MNGSLALMMGGYLFYWALAMTITYFALPEGGPGEKRGPFVIGVVLGTLIPLYGPAIAPFYALYCRVAARKIVPPAIVPVTLPDYRYEAALTPSVETMGGMAARLRRAAREEYRIRAVSRILEPRNPEQYGLLNTALCDPSEEVRLLAHSALDRREHDNMSVIMRMRARLHKTPRTHPAARGRLIEKQAWLAWNIAHQNAGNRPAQPVRECAVAPGDIGEAAQAMVAGSPVMLRGLQALESRRAEEAAQYLQSAQARGVAACVVAPHLAAAYFQLRRWPDVQRLMARSGVLSLSPQYGASAAFWGDMGL